MLYFIGIEKSSVRRARACAYWHVAEKRNTDTKGKNERMGVEKTREETGTSALEKRTMSSTDWKWKIKMHRQDQLQCSQNS